MRYYYEQHEAHKHDDVTQIEYVNHDNHPVIVESDGEEYPYGFDSIESRNIVTGELAERIRRVFVVDNQDEPIYIVEESGDSSYSEYTQEQWSDFWVEVGEWKKQFHGYSAFDDMIKWLDEEAPIETETKD